MRSGRPSLHVIEELFVYDLAVRYFIDCHFFHRESFGLWLKGHVELVSHREVRARHQRTVPLDDALAKPDPQATPEHSALANERTRRLRAAIEALPEQQRECMLLRSSGLQYREIADVLGITTSSVGALVHRATARLTEELHESA